MVEAAFPRPSECGTLPAPHPHIFLPSSATSDGYITTNRSSTLRLHDLLFDMHLYDFQSVSIFQDS